MRKKEDVPKTLQQNLEEYIEKATSLEDASDNGSLNTTEIVEGLVELQRATLYMLKTVNDHVEIAGEAAQLLLNKKKESLQFNDRDMQYIFNRIDPMFADLQLDGINDGAKAEFMRRLKIIINDRIVEKQ